MWRGFEVGLREDVSPFSSSANRAPWPTSLVALAEFDRRRLWVQLGHASVFYYLHRDLALSKGAAHYRKVAARLIQKFPEVVAPFREGKSCITTVMDGYVHH
jgi:hypothetical protein